MKEVYYWEALNEAYKEEMRRDKNVITYGEDVAITDGSFLVTKGLLDEFGPERVRETPLSEVAIVGSSIGASIVGLRPVAEIQFNDFLGVAGDQIINQMAKLRYMSGGQINMPLVLRMPMGGGLQAAAQHSQCLDGTFMSIPGLKIICPSNPADAKGMFKSAIRDDNPVLLFEHIDLYNTKGLIPEGEYLIPIGKADIKKEGKDLTIVAVSDMVNKGLRVAEKFEKEGKSIEVVDVRSLCPLDFDTILNSVKKTGKVIVAYLSSKTNGSGTEIAARLADEAFEYLDAPVKRVAGKDVPIPFAPNMEAFVLPQEQDLIDSIIEIL